MIRREENLNFPSLRQKKKKRNQVEKRLGTEPKVNRDATWDFPAWGAGFLFSFWVSYEYQNAHRHRKLDLHIGLENETLSPSTNLFSSYW